MQSVAPIGYMSRADIFRCRDELLSPTRDKCSEGNLKRKRCEVDIIVAAGTRVKVDLIMTDSDRVRVAL